MNVPLEYVMLNVGLAGVGASADFFIKETRVWCVFLCFHGSLGFYGLDNRLTV